MQETTQQKMRQLIDTLNHASNAYYNGQQEVMSDYEWDALFDELKQLEQQTGVILDDSPTINVSKDSTIGEKEAHEYAALSLTKTKKVEELVKWAEGKEIWLSWKLDGLTLVVTYDHGKLQKVVTRGDGHIGTNITHLASSIFGIQPTISSKEHIVIRGEAVISYADFEQFVLESGEEYANPRNLASGSLSLKDTQEVKKRKIHWIPFTLVHTDTPILSWGKQMQFMEELGFVVVERQCITNPTYNNIQSVIDIWTKKVTDKINPYPVDGLVITYDDVQYAQTGSITGHHATKAGYAFKWADESKESTLDHIEWSCAASTITPVAVFEPIELEGTSVKRASLCNISECERLGIGDTGTVVSVIKANKIIPKIIHVTKKEGTLQIPTMCPVCGAPTVIHESEASLTKTLRCTNSDCAAKKLKKFTRFVSKAGMDIDGISEATLARFINEGWIHAIADIYRLPTHKEEIASLEGFGEKSAENIMLALQKASVVDDTKLIYALNIPLVGQDVAKRLLQAKPIQQLVEEAIYTQDMDVFSSIDGIGSEKSSAFVSWFQNTKNQEDYNDLLQYITINASITEAVDDKCKDLTFVVTGDVHHYPNRNALKAYIEQHGGKVTGSVTKKTNYLINNDVTSTSSKNTKAKSLGIPILSEDEFIEKFGE